MEQQRKFEELVKMLKELKGDGSPDEGKVTDDERAKALGDISNLSKMRIYTVADKIAKSSVNVDIELVDDVAPVQVPLPINRKWDFHVGDQVTIPYTFKDFRSIQQQTIGWRKNLENIYGHHGVVTDVVFPFRNDVQVYFPRIFTSTQLYPGVLKKIQHDPENFAVNSRWKVGDSVKTMTDPEIAELCQSRLPDVPEKYLGKKGKAIAVTTAGVFVTFDEKKSYAISPALLLPGDDAPNFQKKENNKPKEFTIGEEVEVDSNLKTLIKNQKEFGGWNPEMTSLRGNKVTVIKIQKDGGLLVQLPAKRRWPINPDSVHKIQSLKECTEKEEKADDLEFRPGDKVKFLMSENTKMFMARKGINPMFIEYLRTTVSVDSMTDSFKFRVALNSEKKASINGIMLRKATTKEAEKFDEIKAETAKLKKNSRVHLDVGPPNYVKAILKEMKAKSDIIKALTTPATLLGFTDSRHAVIQYDDGKKYMINVKYLTVPEKFEASGTVESLNPEVLLALERKFLECLEAIHKEHGGGDGDWGVNLFAVLPGDPPNAEFKIRSMVASSQDVLQKLREISGWKVEKFGPSEVLLRGMKEYADQSVKVVLLFNDEEYSSSATEVLKYEERGSAKPVAIPFQDEATAPDPIQVKDLSEFRFLRFFDSSLTQDVYFPYVIHGSRRARVAPADDDAQQPEGQNSLHIKAKNVIIQT